MTNMRQALEDIMDAADILVNRRDAVTEYVAILPMSSVRRLERALEQAQKVRAKDGPPLTYLASPYSHPDCFVQKIRYEQACKATATLIRRGHLVYSPIVHSHPLVKHGLPADWSYWREIDEAMLSRCHQLIVLTLDGWEHSKGVMAEIELAHKMDLPIWYIGPGQAEIYRHGGLRHEG
jgi:hypothetical protein